MVFNPQSIYLTYNSMIPTKVMIRPNMKDAQTRIFYSKAKIRFEAMRGYSYLSDVALDDIMLRIDDQPLKIVADLLI